MGGCSSNEHAVRQRPGLSEKQISSVLEKTPNLMSPWVAYHLVTLDTALGGDAVANRENFQAVNVNFSVVWALLLGVAAAGVFEEKPEKTIYGDFTFLGTMYCFSFLCFLVATLESLFFIIMTVSIPNDAEFQHWMKLLGPMPVKYPIYLGLAGIIILMYCIAENMTVQYDPTYTVVCLGKCFVICLVPMFYIPYKMTWAALVTHQTTTEVDQSKQFPVTARSIRESLLTDYFTRELKGDVTKLNREDFVGRFMRNDQKNDFVLKLAGRIYDEFEESKIQEALANVDQKLPVLGQELRPNEDSSTPAAERTWWGCWSTPDGGRPAVSPRESSTLVARAPTEVLPPSTPCTGAQDRHRRC